MSSGRRTLRALLAGCVDERPGPEWRHGAIARRTYHGRLGFARYDLAVNFDGTQGTLILHKGWRWLGRRSAPLCEILRTGWLRIETEYGGWRPPAAPDRSARSSLDPRGQSADAGSGGPPVDLSGGHERS